MDRRDIMMNMRDKREAALDQLHQGISFSAGHQEQHPQQQQYSQYGGSNSNPNNINEAEHNMMQNSGNQLTPGSSATAHYEDVFYSSFKRRQAELEIKRESIQRMIKCMYLICSMIVIVAFTLFMHSEKFRASVSQPNKSSNTSTTKKTRVSSLKQEQQQEMFASEKKAKQRFQFIKRVLEDHNVHEAELLNLNVPQGKAFLWMVKTDPMQRQITGNLTATQVLQRYSLASLYYASHGELWTKDYNFLTEKPECEWGEYNAEGGLIGGAGACEEGHITSINLWNNNLVGHIPRDLSLLSGLRILSVYDNKLRGPLAASLGRLTSLKTLYIHGNFMTGPINFMCGKGIENIRADCHNSANGNAEIQCSCCSVCCSPSGECFQEHV